MRITTMMMNLNNPFATQIGINQQGKNYMKPTTQLKDFKQPFGLCQFFYSVCVVALVANEEESINWGKSWRRAKTHVSWTRICRILSLHSQFLIRYRTNRSFMILRVFSQWKCKLFRFEVEINFKIILFYKFNCFEIII